MAKWNDYPTAVLRGAPEQVEAALAAHYATVPTDQLAAAYTSVAKGLGQLEEVPRGSLGAAVRTHLNIIIAEQQERGKEVSHAQ